MRESMPFQQSSATTHTANNAMCCSRECV